MKLSFPLDGGPDHQADAGTIRSRVLLPHRGAGLRLRWAAHAARHHQEAGNRLSGGGAAKSAGKKRTPASGGAVRRTGACPVP